MAGTPPPPSRLTLKENANGVSLRSAKLGGPELGGAKTQANFPGQLCVIFLLFMLTELAKAKDILFIRSYLFISMEAIYVCV